MNTVFECGTTKCSYSIASEGMNAIQLKALRRWKKTCPKCKQLTLWLEQMPLLNTDTLQTKTYGGSKRENNQISTKEATNHNRRQKRAADRGAGL